MDINEELYWEEYRQYMEENEEAYEKAREEYEIKLCEEEYEIPGYFDDYDLLASSKEAKRGKMTIKLLQPAISKLLYNDDFYIYGGKLVISRVIDGCYNNPTTSISINIKNIKEVYYRDIGFYELDILMGDDTLFKISYDYEDNKRYIDVIETTLEYEEEHRWDYLF